MTGSLGHYRNFRDLVLKRIIEKVKYIFQIERRTAGEITNFVSKINYDNMTSEFLNFKKSSNCECSNLPGVNTFGI